MFDKASATAAVTRDFGAIRTALGELDEAGWKGAVRCAGWTVADLARHVVGAARGQAEGLRRAARGESELARLDPLPPSPPRQLVDELAVAYDALFASLEAVPVDAMVPLPFALLPAGVALQIVALEYGFHRNDLDWALGRMDPLPPDIAATLVEMIPGLLPMLAAGTPVSSGGGAPSGPAAYRLAAPSSQAILRYEDGAWQVADGSGTAACEVRGDDSALALFVMGRIPASDPSLAVSGDASGFKRCFPGP